VSNVDKCGCRVLLLLLAEALGAATLCWEDCMLGSLPTTPEDGPAVRPRA